MGHGPRYNVCDGGFARILRCTIEVNSLRMITLTEMRGNEPKVIDDMLDNLCRCLYSCYSLRGCEGHKPAYYQELSSAARSINVARGYLSKAKRYTKYEDINRKLKTILKHDTK